jgi:hypothetical protein
MAKKQTVSKGCPLPPTEICCTCPLKSKNLQMTFATISSLLSNGLPALEVALVLFADSSELVAPRHSLKSMVEDCSRNAHVSRD